MNKNMTYNQAILAYLKNHDRIIPAFQANSNVNIDKKRHWFGSELGRACRDMSPPRLCLPKDWKNYPLLRGEIIQKDSRGVMRRYVTFFINPKFKI